MLETVNIRAHLQGYLKTTPGEPEPRHIINVLCGGWHWLAITSSLHISKRKKIKLRQSFYILGILFDRVSLILQLTIFVVPSHFQHFYNFKNIDKMTFSRSDKHWLTIKPVSTRQSVLQGIFFPIGTVNWSYITIFRNLDLSK